MSKYDLGVDECLQEVMQDPQCEKDYFSIGADNNCSCKKIGPLAIRKPPAGCDGASYYSIKKVNIIVLYLHDLLLYTDVSLLLAHSLAFLRQITIL